MLSNKQISTTLKQLALLMELHQGDVFKIRTINNATFKLNKLSYPVANKSIEELSQIEGIGKSTAQKIVEIVHQGTLAELEAFLSKTPKGIVDMLKIKGLGAKKVLEIWNLGIENIGDLYYACVENRLVYAKGFGQKTQEDIKQAILFMQANQGKCLYASVEPLMQDILHIIGEKWQLAGELFSETGELRRKSEVIETMVFIASGVDIEQLKQEVILSNLFAELSIEKNNIHAVAYSGVKTTFLLVSKEEYFWQLFLTTGCSDYINNINAKFSNKISFISEEAIYQTANEIYKPPILREKENFHINPIDLVVFEDLSGVLHNHSLWSDGVNSIKEMAVYCRDVMKLEYLGISDHSQTALYANGLSNERVFAQQIEIDKLNKELAPFKIFKGIESDILNDGALDYPNEILASFDFVIASIHSNLKMDDKKSTQRLIKAIENPYTTILGHPTGRLLLNRAGYLIDYKKIIDACATNRVVIEINSNPMRLDLDWRWYNYAIEKGVILSINPDAHNLNGLYDMKYGVIVAQKGGLQKHNILNTMPLIEIQDYFMTRKKN